MHDNSDKARLERALGIIEDYRNYAGTLETERNEIHELYQFQYRMWYAGSFFRAFRELLTIRIRRWYHRNFKRQEHGQQENTRKSI